MVKIIMLTNRLLSEQDCQRIFHEVYGKEECELEAIHKFIEAISAAQLAKTDAEWVEWAETTLRACTTRTCKYHDKNCLYLRDILCGAWQERKRSVGL